MGQGFWGLSPGGTGYPCRCGKLNGGFSPGGTGYPCRCGKLNGGFSPRRHWLALPRGERIISNAAVACDG